MTPPPITPPPDTPPPVSSNPSDPTSEPTPTQRPDGENTPTPEPTQGGENTPSPTPTFGASATPSASPGSASPSPTVAGMITARPSSSPLATPPGSDYRVIATMDSRGNEFSIILFYGGAAAIFLGLIGIIVLIVLYVKNRKKRGTLERDGIFEEIEDAETRSAPPQYDVFDDEYDDDYDPYEQYDIQNQGGTRYNDDYAAPAAPQPGPVMPMDISMYTDEFDRSELYTQPEAPEQPDSYDGDYADSTDEQVYDDYSYEDTQDDYGDSQVSFDTDEILREALRDDEDYGEDE